MDTYPVTAASIIATGISGGTTEALRVLIKELSHRLLDVEGLQDELVFRHDIDRSLVSLNKLRALLLHTKRKNGDPVFGKLDDLWYVYHTFTDPAVHEYLNEEQTFLTATYCHPVYGITALINVLIDILRQGDKQMVDLVTAVCQYRKFYTKDKVDLERFVRRVLQAHKDVFTRRHVGRTQRWYLVDPNEAEPTLQDQMEGLTNGRDRRDALAVLFSRRYILRGWSFREVHNICQLPSAILWFNNSHEVHNFEQSVSDMVNHKDEIRFEQVPSAEVATKGNPLRFRLAHISSLRQPTAEEWAGILQHTLLEYGGFIPYEKIAPLCRQIGPHLGFDIPLSSLANTVNKAGHGILKEVTVTVPPKKKGGKKTKEKRYCLKIPN